MIQQNNLSVKSYNPVKIFWTEVAPTLDLLYNSDMVDRSSIPEIKHENFKKTDNFYICALIIEILDKYESIEETKKRRLSIPCLQIRAEYINNSDVQFWVSGYLASDSDFMQSVKSVFNTLNISEIGCYDADNNYHIYQTAN